MEGKISLISLANLAISISAYSWKEIGWDCTSDHECSVGCSPQPCPLTYKHYIFTLMKFFKTHFGFDIGNVMGKVCFWYLCGKCCCWWWLKTEEQPKCAGHFLINQVYFYNDVFGYIYHLFSFFHERRRHANSFVSSAIFPLSPPIHPVKLFCFFLYYIHFWFASVPCCDIFCPFPLHV